MRRLAPLALVLAALVTAAVAFAQPAEPKKPVRWLVHAIEMSTEKDAEFKGTVIVRLDGSASQIAYHWGGKCKDSKLGTMQLDLLLHALDHGYGVEIQGDPKPAGDRVAMCMRSVRVVAPTNP